MKDMDNGPVPPCASCGERDRIAKLSRIYFDALSMIAHPAQTLPQSLSLLQGRKGQKPRGIGRSRYYHDVVRMVAPPSGARKVVRLLHPDAVVFGFAAISGLVLFQMFRSRLLELIPAVGVLALALAAYLLGRRFVIRRYRRERDREAGEGQRIRSAVEQWMKLYYCGKEGTAFDPGSGRTYPLAGLAQRLLNDQPQ
jgi:hypothetical protein